MTSILEITENVEDISECPSYDYFTIPKEESNLSYEDFLNKYLLQNKPCIIKNIIGSTWECSRKWLLDKNINYDYFIEAYGDLVAPVANCNIPSYNSHCKEDMKIKDYMAYLKSGIRERLLYLKDWHLRKIRPNDNFYEVPKLFGSDWLNEYAQDNNSDDFMFVYIGPASSWTPLHSDVYSSYSWSINVTGLKKWILFPPGEERKLKDSHGNMPLSFEKDKFIDIKYFEIYQERGDAMFVPSGWVHQVINVVETISINHNWVNSCNIQLVWKALCDNLKMVEQEIAQFKGTPEFINDCQNILKAHFGMDFQVFITLLIHISKKRLSFMQGNIQPMFNKYILGKKHIEFDLKHILEVINCIIVEKYFERTIPNDMKTNLFNIKNSILKIQHV